MKTSSCIFLISIIATSFIQCAAHKRAIINKNSSPVTSILIFPICSQIDVVEKKDQKIRSETLSSASEAAIKKHLDKYIPEDVKKYYFECNEQHQVEIINTNFQLIKSVKRAVVIKNTKVPEYLLEILDSMKEDYGLFIFHEGFTRTQVNLEKEYTRRYMLGFETAGFYRTEPNAAYSVMIGLLIDRKKRQVAMYKELYWRNRDPNEEVVVRSQVRDIILWYYQNVK